MSSSCDLPSGKARFFNIPDCCGLSQYSVWRIDLQSSTTGRPELPQCHS